MPPRRTRTDTKAASRKSPPAPARRQTTSAKAPRRTSNKATVADEPMEVDAQSSDVEVVDDAVEAAKAKKIKKPVIAVKAEKVAGRKVAAPRPRPVKKAKEPSPDRDEGYETDNADNQGADEDEDGLENFVVDGAENAEDDDDQHGMDVDVDEDDVPPAAASSPMPAKISDLRKRQPATKKRSQKDLSDTEEAPVKKKQAKLSKASPKKIVARGYSGQQVELQVRSKDGVAKEKAKVIKPSATTNTKPRPSAIRPNQSAKKLEEPKVKSKNAVKQEEEEEEEEEEESAVAEDVEDAQEGRADEEAEEEEAEEGDEEDADGEEGKEEEDGEDAQERGQEEDMDVDGQQEADRGRKTKKEASKGKAKSSCPTPEEAGCEVTRLEKQTEPLRGTLDNAPPLTQSHLAPTNEPQFATSELLVDGGSQFPEDINKPRLVSAITVVTIPSAVITNPSRDHPSRLSQKAFNNGHILAFENGEIADVIFFGYVTRSILVSGRTYPSPSGKETRLLKELDIVLLAQEGERAFAMLSMATGGKIITLPITEDGGITFSTKHTTVDEDGNPATKTKLNPKFLAKASGSSSSTVKAVHKDIVRRPREGTDTVPVFNCTKHFRGDPKALRKEPFSAHDILTQRKAKDPLWNAEIPHEAFVCVHSTVSVYANRATPKVKVMSFNLSAVQIIALPKSS